MPVFINPPDSDTKTMTAPPTPETHAADQTPQSRAHRLAKLIADILCAQQSPDGNFPQHSFYATAFAVALWQGLGGNKYQPAITAAIDALQNQANDPDYHREFIEFALYQAPGISQDMRKRILAGKRYRNARVANWLILRMLCLEKGNRPSRLVARVMWRMISRHFRDGAAFMDRKGSFSAQYHAFCATLLSFSTRPVCREAGHMATGLITELVATTGHANLIGRGAGQSFGTVSALYALLNAGENTCATILLDQIEQSLIANGTLPLNLLAKGGGHSSAPSAPFFAQSQTPMPASPFANPGADTALPANVMPLRAHSIPATYHPFKPSSDATLADKADRPFAHNPGPDNPETPGWYSYNREFDYLAFAGFFLLRAAQLPLTTPENPSPPTAPAKPQNRKNMLVSPFHHCSTAHYSALFNLSGRAPYDVTPMPVVTSPGGHIILPACGGEQDFASLYGAASVPLPCCPLRNQFARYDTATHQDDTILVHFHVGGYIGTRRIVFFPDAIEFTDRVDINPDIAINDSPDTTTPAAQTDDIIRLFRLFLPHDLHATQHHPNRLSFPHIGLEITGSSPLHLTPSKHFSAFGLAQTLFCQKTALEDGTCQASLKLHWLAKN
ncbi:hypothetical protein [uncultured Thalassospira sp.]|uniref:hypothetical protein n=1 Tax=uncultured Thalassospira sp. TaxID=404382 RepID=UPI0030DDD7D5|tara:strand:+ start:2242 stop:4089 length:1848 start_codon:yes stop_codon:yes gene_type:complete